MSNNHKNSMSLSEENINAMVLRTLDSIADFHGYSKFRDRVHYHRFCHALKKIIIDHDLGVGKNGSAKILDIGPGGGTMIIVLKEFGCQCVGINPNMVFADQIFMTKSRVPCIIGEIEVDGLPFADAIFDGVLFMAVIEHFHHSPKFPLMEINRVLKPGGFLYVDTPNSRDFRARIRPWFGRSNFPPLTSYYDLPRNQTHVHEYTINELEFVLTKTGFEILDLNFFSDITYLSVVNFRRNLTGHLTYDVGGFHPLRIWDWIRFPYRILCRLVPSFCDAIYALARKKG